MIDYGKSLIFILLSIHFIIKFVKSKKLSDLTKGLLAILCLTSARFMFDPYRSEFLNNRPYVILNIIVCLCIVLTLACQYYNARKSKKLNQL